MTETSNSSENKEIRTRISILEETVNVIETEIEPLIHLPGEVKGVKQEMAEWLFETHDKNKSPRLAYRTVHREPDSSLPRATANTTRTSNQISNRLDINLNWQAAKQHETHDLETQQTKQIKEIKEKMSGLEVTQ